MFKPIKIISIEISDPFDDLKDLNGYEYLWALIKFRSVPLGYVKLPVIDGGVAYYSIIRKAVKKFNKKIISLLIQINFDLLSSDKKLSIKELFTRKNNKEKHSLFFTVAVCTRNRSADLEICLNSLLKIEYPNLEIIVVDNAPDDNSTEELVKKLHKIKYIREPYPGLDWARNKAITEAQGDIIVFTDDDVVVDKNWINSLANLFEDDSEIIAVTGLVLPYEIETDAQYLFEKYGGFSRGFKRGWHKLKNKNQKAAKDFGGSGKFGTGANMAYRKSIFNKIGFFDPALDVGTVTNGGGDLEMFFRVLKEGYTLVYEPAAIVYHRHRKNLQQLKLQLTNNGIGFYSYLVRSCSFYPEEKASIFYLGLWWFYIWNIRRLLMSFPAPHRFPRDLIKAEFAGSLKGLFRYRDTKRNVIKIDNFLYKNYLQKNNSQNVNESFPSEKGEAKLYVLDLNEEIKISGTENYQRNLFYIKKGGIFLCKVLIQNNYHKISRDRLIEDIANQLNINLLKHFLNKEISEKNISKILFSFFIKINKGCISKEIRSASIVIATYDRPNELNECLSSLRKIKSKVKTEIIVVDNNPSSGITPKITADFPEVILLDEERKGLSYARNKGFSKCKGDVAVSIDDDVIVSEDWLNKIIVPFKDDNVAAVTGNTLPFELKTEAENLFEIYGGLGRGFKRKYYDKDWFLKPGLHALPTWEIGATANAAFRTYIFKHSEIGLLDESLGAGTPTGCSEDTYLFYKIIKAGFAIVYEPKAYLWHKHRKDVKAFKKQLYNYSKGHVAYNLLTYFNDKDARGIFRIVIELPLAHLQRIFKRIRRKSNYPITFVLIEIMGNLMGPAALYFSKKNVNKLRIERNILFENLQAFSHNDNRIQIRNTIN